MHWQLLWISLVFSTLLALGLVEFFFFLGSEKNLRPPQIHPTLFSALRAPNLVERQAHSHFPGPFHQLIGTEERGGDLLVLPPPVHPGTRLARRERNKRQPARLDSGRPHPLFRPSPDSLPNLADASDQH